VTHPSRCEPRRYRHCGTTTTPKRSRIPRQEVARQLGDYDDHRSVEALGRLLQDEDVFVRDWAAESLLRLNRPAARKFWNQVLDDPSADVREAAARALAELESQ
jgi:HEAT repeat protein